jgi:hypothetical protein
LTAFSAPAQSRRVALHLVAVAALWAVDLGLGNPVITLVVGGLLMTFIYVKLGMDELHATPLRLSPLSFYFFWDSIVVGPSAIDAAFCISSGEPLNLGPWSVPPDDVAAGYLIFLTGSVALHAGFQYCRPVGNIDRGVPCVYSNTAFLWLLAVLYAVGLIGLMKPTLTDPLGAAFGPAILASAITALSCFALSRRDLDMSPFLFVVIMLLGSAGLLVGNLNSGSKSALMFSFFPLIWFLLLYHPRWLPLAGVVGFLIYSVVWQVVNLSRNNSRYYATKQSVTQSDEFANQMLDAFQQWRRGARAEAEHSDSANSGTFHTFLSRQFQPLPVGFIAHEVREGGLLMGGPLDYVGITLVPRLFWPDKPRVIRGAWFTFMIGMADSPDAATTNTAQYAAGELYWNFGLPGVIVGMVLIGALLGKLWQMAGSNPHRDPLRMVLYILIMQSTQEMAEAGTVLTGIVANFLVFGTALRIQKLALRDTPNQLSCPGTAKLNNG